MFIDFIVWYLLSCFYKSIFCIMKNREELMRIVRFAVVGFSNFLIISLFVWLMMEVFHRDMVIANVIAYSIALVNNFVWNKVWVFRAKGGNLLKEIALNLIAYGTAYLLQLGFSFSMVEWVGLNEYMAQFLGLFIFGATNFIMNKMLTFKN